MRATGRAQTRCIGSVHDVPFVWPVEDMLKTGDSSSAANRRRAIPEQSASALPGGTQTLGHNPFAGAESRAGLS